MTIRKQPTTLDDVKKHFTKKGITDLDDLCDQLPNSPTPSDVSYRFEDEGQEVFDTEEHGSIPCWRHSSGERDEEEQWDTANDPNMLGFPTATASLNSFTPTQDNDTDLFYDNLPDDIFASQFQRRLTLEDDQPQTDDSNANIDATGHQEDTVLLQLGCLLAMTLGSIRPKPPDLGPRCKGVAIINAHADAVKRKNQDEAYYWYHKGLDMMEEMTKVPDPFSIVHICDLMRIALTSNNDAMPEAMLSYVSRMKTPNYPDHPLKLLVVSVMKANSYQQARWRLLGLVYQNAIEMTTIKLGVEHAVVKALKRRYEVFRSFE